MAPTTAHQWLVVYGNSANQIAAFALVYLSQAVVFPNKALVIILTRTHVCHQSIMGHFVQGNS